MSDPHKDAKDELRRHLQAGREALVATLEGIGDGQAGRPVAGSATSLLGLARQMAAMEAGYLGQVFDNPYPDDLPWWDGESEPDGRSAAGDDSVDSVVALYRRVWAHCDETADVLGLGAPGRVTWWPADRAEVNLHQVLVLLVAATQHAAGQAQVARATSLGAGDSGRP